MYMYMYMVYTWHMCIHALCNVYMYIVEQAFGFYLVYITLSLHLGDLCT